MKTLLFILTLLVIISCSTQEERPKGILTDQQMIDLLVDVQLLEGSTNMIQANGKDFNKYATRQYAGLFNKHKINKQLFEENLKYFAAKPELMQELYTTVIDSLSKLKSHVQIEKTN